MKRVPFPIIQAAKELDTEAVEFVFRHFEGFIASQSLIGYYNFIGEIDFSPEYHR